MKKRGILIGLVMVLLLTGCTKNTTPETSSGTLTVSEAPVSVPVENPVDNSAGNPVENPVGNSAGNKEQFVEDAVVYNMSCGYLGDNFAPDQYTLYLVTNEEELCYAEFYLGMQVPENVDEISGFNTGLAEAFQKMKEDYPISDYNYLLEYLEYSQGGYYHHSDGIVYEGDKISFHYDKSVSPEGEFGTDVMEGDFMMAAVPKTFFEGKNFRNVVRYGISLTGEGEDSAFNNEVEEGYIAKFENGNPDYVSEMFVYETGDGYKCLKAHHAFILGTSKWERTIEFYRIVPNKEDVVQVAKEFIGQGGFVFYPGDDKNYDVEDFLTK